MGAYAASPAESSASALAALLVTYQDRHKLRTPRGMIERWAPKVENDTTALSRWWRGRSAHAIDGGHAEQGTDHDPLARGDAARIGDGQRQAGRTEGGGAQRPP